MNKMIIVLMMIAVSSFAHAKINPETGVDFAVENEEWATLILSHKTRKARLEAASNHFIDVLYKGQCDKTVAGKPYRMETTEADGVLTIMCGKQELVQLEAKEGSTFTKMKVRMRWAEDSPTPGDFGDWKTPSATEELGMFWPQLTNLKSK